MKGIWSLLVFLLLLPGAGFGQDLGNLEVNGFLLGNYSGRTTGQGPDGNRGSDFLLAEERLRLDIGSWSDTVEASAGAKGDFIHDAVDGEFDIDLREAYVDYTTGDFDLRLGRQIITWGVGDLLFINDVFPKDWVSFFSGRPLEYLKIGVDGFQTRYSPQAVNAELLVIPFFEPDKLPTSERFFLFDPLAAAPAWEVEEPASTYVNTELALRLYRKVSDVDLSLYAYRGFWRMPSMRPDSFVAPTRGSTFFSKLSVYGMSAQGNAFGGILGFEVGYYDSRDDRDGDDPAIPNSQHRFLAGYQRQIQQDFTVGVQYYAEIMAKHGAYERSHPAGFPPQRRYRDTVTLRLERLFRHQTLRLGLLTFYSPADRDYLLQPQLRYQFSDELSATLGANLFGGEKDSTFLGQFDRNDNVHLAVRFNF
jgi:hypothetical protein